jgi:Cu(I)/Ag(I) efflux system protein CusF
MFKFLSPIATVSLAALLSSPLVVMAATTDNASAVVVTKATTAAATNAAAVTLSSGEIKKIDLDAGKMTIQHGPLVNLKMPAMTMAFKAKDPAILKSVKVGDKVRFLAESVNGSLVVTTLEKQP